MSDFPVISALAQTLLGHSREDLCKMAAALGQPAYRGNQIADWLYAGKCASIDEMSNLPKGFRAKLAERARVGTPEVVAATGAPDRTAKFLLDFDGVRVETVLLPSDDRVSVCVSSQVGCAAGCTFCATATLGLTRNLSAGEIVAQVLVAARALESAPWYASQQPGARAVNHVVYMGMGEPLWNLENVVKSIRLLNEEVGIGMRGITVSTVGIPDEIRRLADYNLQITLAVSLHAGTEETRQALVPVGRKFPLNQVLEASRYYFDVTGRRVTYEYVLLKGVNDSPEEAFALANRISGVPAHVNLIPWNPAESRGSFERPRGDDIRRFRAVLERAGVAVTQRRERGQGIAAACGQLAGSR
ncbi:MAG TPA: 23S rRNA (adenine(2503)-C(2))-methyltransferase RlmN [Armatimonadota bacterium]|jgi:23S rRNA (adenine2503-C2)-methyltransferase